MKPYFMIPMIPIALCSAACSTLPTSQSVSDFGAAASVGTGLLRNAVSAHRTIALRIGEEDQVGRLLVRSRWSLGDRPDAMLSEVSLQPRLAALAALNEYAEALKSAADQGVIDRLEQAATNLGTAVSGVATVASPASAPIVGPAIRIASRGLGYLLGNAYAGEIHAIIVAHDADVQAIVDVLKVDLAGISGVLRLQLDDYEKQRKLTLLEIQQDPLVDRLALYHEYKVARQDVSGLKVLVAAISNYSQLLSNLAETHSALAQDKPDAQAALNKFMSLTADLSTLLTAVKKENV